MANIHVDEWAFAKFQVELVCSVALHAISHRCPRTDMQTATVQHISGFRLVRRDIRFAIPALSSERARGATVSCELP